MVPCTTKVCDIGRDVPAIVSNTTKRCQARQPRPLEGSEGRCLIVTSGLKTIGECVYYAAGDEEHVKALLQLFGYVRTSMSAFRVNQERNGCMTSAAS